nr:unnamed protein product [Digitaria exilis]
MLLDLSSPNPPPDPEPPPAATPRSGDAAGSYPQIQTCRRQLPSDLDPFSPRLPWCARARPLHAAASTAPRPRQSFSHRQLGRAAPSRDEVEARMQRRGWCMTWWRYGGGGAHAEEGEGEKHGGTMVEEKHMRMRERERKVEASWWRRSVCGGRGGSVVEERMQ